MIDIGSFGVKECSWKKWFFWIIPHSWGCFKFLKFDSFWSITPNLHFILITRLWNFVGFCGFLKKVRIFIDSGERICGESINFVLFLPLFEFVHNQGLNWKFEGDFIMDHVIGGKFKLGRKIGSGSFGELYLGLFIFVPFFLFLIHLFGYIVL